MKLYQRLAIAAAMTLGVFGGVTTSHAQSTPIWSSYDVQYVNQFYNPLAGANLIPVTSFLNFAGSPDADDGTAVNIPVGFTFEYNGALYNSVNVNVNGWISLGTQPIPITPNNNNNLFTPTQPNNTIAPYWGDHYYRTIADPGFRPSRISYATTATPATNTDACNPFAFVHVFTVEWKDLNINDKTNPNSIASFQVKIVENQDAYLCNPDKRATIEFHYGPIGTVGTVQTVGAAVGIEDSTGSTHMNGLFPSNLDNENATRNNTSARTDCWPPATCLPGRIIQFVPEGRGSFAQWGDGDVNLDQLYNTNALVRNNQSLFVTLADADIILQSRAYGRPLDSVEGRAAFHGDANHTGRGYHDAFGVFHPNSIDPNYGQYFYFVTSYDAAYIMMYLAAKIPSLPWPDGLPIPGYKPTDSRSTNVSGIVAMGENARVNGSTVLVPVTVRGIVNGALGVEMNVASTNESAMQFIGTRGTDGTLMRSNAADGKVVFAAAGHYDDGATIGYLEFRSNDLANAGFTMTNVTVNDQPMPSSATSFKLNGVTPNGAAGYELAQNAPNPFNVTANGTTAIAFDIAASENVTLRVYDMLGHEVRTLVADEFRGAGHNSVKWDGRDANGNLVAGGFYYYELVTPSFTKTVKMQVIR
jgi:hypothetical protein